MADWHLGESLSYKSLTTVLSGPEASSTSVGASGKGVSEPLPYQPLPLSFAETEYAVFAAITIQRFYRGYKCRTQYLRTLAAIKAATEEEYATFEAWRRAELAARCVQRAWKSYRDRRIFRYYRDLIQFRQRGDPRELLRCINPKEAQLAEPAAGLHVRFRLGGFQFPPLIYYKIYTHRTVTDINSFCPRDYSNEINMPATMMHNNPKDKTVKAAPKTSKPARPTTKKGWYERWENNGWRPVAAAVLLEEDPVTASTRQKTLPVFHYNPTIRREEKLRRQKQRKRDWLMKMYRDGMLGGNTAAHAKVKALAEAEAAGVADLDPALDDLAALDEAAAELTEWSAALDFDQYLNGWTELACSLGSEAFVPELEAPFLEELNNTNMVLDLPTALQNAGVPLAPYKGGAVPTCSVLSSTPLRS